METFKKIYQWIVNILFFNIPIFITTCIGIFVLSLVLLIYGSCFLKQPDITAKDISMYPLDRPIPTLPMTLYVTDEFSDKKVDILKKAAEDWKIFSKGIITITISPNFDPPEPFSESFYSYFPKKTIWMKTGDEKNVAELFLKYSINGDGFSVGNFIVIIDSFDKLSENNLYIILKHEIGHQLALEHINPQYPALMNPNGNFGQFTINDKIVFCYLYDCDYKKL